MDVHEAYKRFFEMCLRRLHNMETITKEGLNAMIDGAKTSSLRESLIKHREDTQRQIQRIESICQKNNIELNPPKEGIQGTIEKGKEMLQSIAEKITRHSTGIQEFINEGNRSIEEFKDSDAIDFAIGSAQLLVEHIEIAAYTSIIQIAEDLGFKEAKELLSKTLQEEQKMADYIQNQLPSLSHIHEKAS